MGSIVGVVRVVRGSFPQPILVNVLVHGATIQSYYTDAEGRFAFNGLYANVYHVTINDDLYQPFERTVELKPDIQPMYILQIMLVPRETKSDAASGAYVVSPADFTKMYPKKAVKEFEKGVKLESENKTDDAIDHYRKAIKEAPNFSNAHNNLGSLLMGKSQFGDAQKELQESIRLAPADAKSYFNMANLMLLTGKLAEAEHYLQEGFRRQADSAFGFFVQGSVLEQSGKLREAEMALRRALQLDARITRAHLQLVNLYLHEQRPADAITELHEFLKVAPNDPLAPKAREVLQKLETATKASVQHPSKLPK